MIMFLVVHKVGFLCVCVCVYDKVSVTAEAFRLCSAVSGNLKEQFWQIIGVGLNIAWMKLSSLMQ